MLGIFKKELKHRFLCEVEINKKIEECYISCSSHLLPMIDLVNKKVILKKNKGKNLKTQYTVQALWEDNEKILLNLNYVNDLVKKYLSEIYNPNLIKREYKIKNYKSDFFIIDKKIIIEAKGLLSNNNTVYFPFKSGERCLHQLKEIKKLIKQGNDVEYYFILLNPKINRIKLDTRYKEYCSLLNTCIKLGMKLKIFNIKWNHYDCALKITNNIKFT